MGGVGEWCISGDAFGPGGAGGFGGGGGGGVESGGGGGGATAIFYAAGPRLTAGGGGGGLHTPVGDAAGGDAGPTGVDASAGASVSGQPGGGGGTASGDGGAAPTIASLGVFGSAGGGGGVASGGASPGGSPGGHGQGGFGGGGEHVVSNEERFRPIPAIPGATPARTRPAPAGSAGSRPSLGSAAATRGAGHTPAAVTAPTSAVNALDSAGGGGGGGAGFGGGGGGIGGGGGGGGYGAGAGGNGAGGGGSSWVTSRATLVSSSVSSGFGDGSATVSYDPDADRCPPTVVPGGGVVTAPTSGSTDLSVSVTLSRSSSVPATAHWSTLFVPGAPGSAFGPRRRSATTCPSAGPSPLRRATPRPASTSP